MLGMHEKVYEGKGLSLRAYWLISSSLLAPILYARKSWPMWRYPFNVWMWTFFPEENPPRCVGSSSRKDILPNVDFLPGTVSSAPVWWFIQAGISSFISIAD